MELKRVKVHEYFDVYRLMKKENFPDLPSDFDLAQPFFEDCVIYGLFSEQSRLLAAFVLGGFTENSAFLDVVCARHMRGKWASKGVLRFLYQNIFNHMKLDFIWTQPHSKTALRAVLAAGFLPSDGETFMEGCVPTLLLSRGQAQHRLHKILKHED